MKAIAILAGAVLLSGGAANAQADGYRCEAVHKDARGALDISSRLDAAGKPDALGGSWAYRSGSVALQAIWVTKPPSLAGTAQVNVTIRRDPATKRRTEGLTVLVMRPGNPDPAFEKGVITYGFDDYTTGIDIDMLEAASRGGRLELVVVDRDWQAQGHGSFDPAVFRGGRAMLAEGLAEIETKQADFRNRCVPVQVGHRE